MFNTLRRCGKTRTVKIIFLTGKLVKKKKHYKISSICELIEREPKSHHYC